LTYCNNLESDQATDLEEITTLAGDTKQEGNRVADVAKDKLKSQVIITAEVDVVAPPGQETVDKRDETQDAEQSGGNHEADLQTKPGTVRKGMQHVGSAVLIVVRDHDASAGQSLLPFWVPQLAESQRSWDGHDARRDQSLAVDTHANVGDEHTTSDGRETGAHDLVDLGHGEVSNERLDQHSGFTLTDEGRGRSDDGLGTRDAHAPEEEDGELADEPLDSAPVVEELDKGDEEDDGRNDTGQEPMQRKNTLGRQERDTSVGEAKQITGQFGDESEDVTARLVSCESDREEEAKTYYPALLRSTKRAMMNWSNMPTMTVCHWMCLRSREVAHRTKMKTIRPNSETARFSRVLSALSSEAKEPMMMTARQMKAPAGTRSFSGTKLAILTPVLFQTKCMGLVTMVMGTWKKMRRRVMASQSKKGLIQFRSWRWLTRPAIHQPVKRAKMKASEARLTSRSWQTIVAKRTG
jgi:hypothetical protein